jgi:hypothetical protein
MELLFDQSLQLFETLQTFRDGEKLREHVEQLFEKLLKDDVMVYA